MKYSGVSLFSGAGGLDIGFEKAGFEIPFANELDCDAANTWRNNRRNNDAMHQGDIHDYLEHLSSFAGADVVFGGPPCQGFSVAGKMDPDDPRSKLMWSFMDVVERVQPRIFIIENVRALGVLNKWCEIRREIRQRALRLGYECSFAIYDASDFAVPQRRERFVIVGSKDSGRVSRFHKSMEEHKSKAATTRETLTNVGHYGSEDNLQTCTSHVSLAKNPVLRKSPYAGMLVNGAGRPMDLDGVAPTLPASMGGNKTPIVDQLALEEGKENWFASYHRALLAGTITPQETSVPSTIRRLTVKEAAALQTFPGDYEFFGKKTQQYKQIGNAVAPSFAHAIAMSVATIL